MLVHRLRRWPNVIPALGRRFVFDAGKSTDLFACNLVLMICGKRIAAGHSCLLMLRRTGERLWRPRDGIEGGGGGIATQHVPVVADPYDPIT